MLSTFQMAWMVSFGFLTAQLCSLETHLGKNHILVRLVDIKAKKLFLVSADIISSRAFNNIAKRAKIEALHTMAVEAPGRPDPKTQNTASTVVVRPMLHARKAVQATSNLVSKGSRSVGQSGLPGLGTCKERNLLELTKRDERVNIVHHVAVLNNPRH